MPRQAIEADLGQWIAGRAFDRDVTVPYFRGDTDDEQQRSGQEAGSHRVSFGDDHWRVVLMALGVGRSVTMVLLPIGLLLGLAGIGVLIWRLSPGFRK
jgi:hypothetical protein